LILKLRSVRNIAGLMIVLIAALALSACGGSDAAAAEPAPAATQKPTPVPTETPVPALPEVAVTPIEVPEPGSDEEIILAVFKQQVRAMNTRDYESFTATCPPGEWENNQATWDKLAFWWDQGADLGKLLPDFTYQSFNARGVEFKTYPKDVVATKFNVYNYDTLLVEGYSWWWEKIDGEWCSTSRTCTGATGRQT
jgi:hypothetical protein